MLKGNLCTRKKFNIFMLNLSHEASTISEQFIIWKHDIGELLRTLTKQKLFFI